MPSFLYYTNFTDDLNYHLKSLDTADNPDYQIQNNKALEMLYRVNVGQNQVPPNQDTGMFRNWDNDFPLYLKKQYPQSISSGFGEHLNYLRNTVPNYTAPEVVYLTSRNYGKDAKEDYNVTWSFEVDSTFTYMVRLHFCEFNEDIKGQGYRVFQIFIDDILAENAADVFSWSGGLLVPVHKDYAVTMYSPKGSSQIERVNISIKLQRMPDHSTLTTAYHDVLLNGIEIFKISDNNNNLAGVNPKYFSPNEPLSPNPQSNSKNSTIIIFIAVGVSCLLLASVVG
ncbi:feronia receptor-like kinase, partial [Trifolium medium]|nr:feronia receptor-like kinase [Trifolium medium]